ncbi:nuclear transport factor 2 family protein [Actinokineospora enzanensis]|uniref:nuclear transport factor 2 family protein n=1 Tax=Actinokineospora enzanensis TaxID=155975 RepID=UPI000366B139|nr:nuclear transport factor 2 family protein [Actinokineospora enzanensis]
MSTEKEIRELVDRWAAAEVAGDVDTLSAITVDDFTVVGPVGFVLPKAAWLDRYASGSLKTAKVTVDELAVRDHGETAVAIGKHSEEMAYQGNPTQGEFRITHILARRDGAWLLAGQHLSQIRDPRQQG